MNTFYRIGYWLGFQIGKLLPLPKTVWIVEGWMGDIEWIETIYTTRQEAEAHVTRLWQTRTAENPSIPVWTQGFCKFAAVEHEVRR